MSIEYWNSTANTKMFTHPLDVELLLRFIAKDATIVDFGCGYGRIVKQLQDAGFKNTKGFDTSGALITRGVKDGVGDIFHIASFDELPIDKNEIDCVLLFAVLTCIPSNDEQRKLIDTLFDKLKPGGILYISDYYLQEHSTEMKRYEYLNDDEENYGVFSLPDGAMFRHHTKEWMVKLLEKFEITLEKTIEVKTMNGNMGKAFQIIAQKNTNE